MLNIGDRVQVIDQYAFAHIELLNHVGIITAAEPANNIVQVPMYDVHIDNDVYVLYDDEITLVTICGLD